MITTVGTGFTIAIPKEITELLNLSCGDKVEINAADGCILIMPLNGCIETAYTDSLRRTVDLVAEKLIFD